MAVNKISWKTIAHITEPGRYQFSFGWLSVGAEDFAVGERFPNALFTLVSTGSAHGEEYHLGAFDPGEDLALG